MQSDRQRLDNLIVEIGLCDSRNKAKSLIKDGKVSVDGRVVLKPALLVSAASAVKLLTQDAYVARSAYKLINALDMFSLNVGGLIAADIGASTGGFTQVLLERGAQKVYAIDVGTGQLSDKLRANSRVVNLEKVNARSLNRNMFDDNIDFATMDLSFISVSYVLGPVYNILAERGTLLCLVKPQFELGPQSLSKNGVVKNIALQHEAVLKIAGFAAELGFTVCGGGFCGVEGESGNREYFLYLSKDNSKQAVGPNKLKECLRGCVL